MGNVNAIVEGCSALVHGVLEDRGCCGQTERWEEPLWHPLAPEQSRACLQPFSAAQAAGHLPGHLCQGSQPCLFLSLPRP